MNIQAKIALCGAALIGFCAPACATEEPAPQVVSAEQTLTEIQVDGARVRFIEMEPGYPMAVAESAPGHNPLADEAVQGMSLAELYQHWTNQPAPEVLQAAEARALAVRDSEITDIEELQSPLLDLEPQDALVDKASLSAAQFQAAYCQGMPICWLDRTGTGEVERRSAWIYGWVNPVRGNVALQIRVYKVIGGWRNTLAVDVLQGQELRYTGGGNIFVERQTKVKVHNADGDHYHWSMTW